ncbi:MAG: prepilin-type N-terminal cleavage/methylation domain-containing protein [Patescibacteria group bacterium]
MARNITYKKGFTLIELVLYMGVFTILVVGILYTSMYIQKVLQDSAVRYEIDEIIYRQLALLQNHITLATHIEVSTSSIRMYSQNSIVTQELRSGILFMIYEYGNGQKKEFAIYPTMKFSEFSFRDNETGETFETKNQLRVQVDRIGVKGKLMSLEEYFYTY